MKKVHAPNKWKKNKLTKKKMTKKEFLRLPRDKQCLLLARKLGIIKKE